MKLFLLLLLGSLAPAMLPAQEQPRATAGYQDPGAVLRKIIVDALTARGLQPDEMPSELNLTMAPENVSLQVEDVFWDSIRHVVQIRMACEQPAMCLPFLIAARVPPGNESAVREKLSRGIAPSVRRTHGAPALVRNGKPATLRVQNYGVRISTPVVCLQPGAEGEWVRVRIAKTRSIVLAQVVGAGLVSVPGKP